MLPIRIKTFTELAKGKAFNSMGTIEGISGAPILEQFFNDWLLLYIYEFICKIVLVLYYIFFVKSYYLRALLYQLIL